MLGCITHHEQVDGGYYHLIADVPAIAAEAKPGQFVMIRVTSDSHDPLLRRPISIMDVHDGSMELLYKVVGAGTRCLTRYPVGAELDVVGPLGHGFNVQNKPHTALVVGGGIGIPPLVYLTRHLLENNRNDVRAFLGARTRADLPMVERFSHMGVNIRTTTENGEFGIKGRVTEPLEELLNDPETRIDNTVLYACGPDPMLEALQKISKKYNIRTQLSLEEHMGCGVGACLGCVVETVDGFKRVCADGPVFDAQTITKWNS